MTLWKMHLIAFIDERISIILMSVRYMKPLPEKWGKRALFCPEETISSREHT